MDDIEIVDSDPTWPDKFEAERTVLLSVLGEDGVLAIEHFGSTAVPNLPAKPIIDILIAVQDLSAAKAAFVPKLDTIGYVFWADNPKTDRLFFVKGLPPYGPKRSHHIHVAERPSEMWSQLAFRDYLRANPNVAQEYAALKRQLATQYRHDREAYTQAKGDFIATIMKRAADSA